MFICPDCRKPAINTTPHRDPVGWTDGVHPHLLEWAHADGTTLCMAMTSDDGLQPVVPLWKRGE